MRRLGILLFATLAAGHAAAQQGGASASGIRTTGCGKSFAADVEYFISVELGALEQASVSSEVRVSCRGASVMVEVSEHGHSEKRSMDLSKTAASVRARVVALTVAELVSKLRDARGAGPPEPEQAPPAPSQPAQARPEAPRRKPTPIAELEAFAQAARFSSSSQLLLGGGLRFKYKELAPWRLALDFGASTYEREAALGSVRLVAASLGARLGYAIPWGDAALELGAGQRVGIARITGQADTDSANSGSVVGAWAAPFGFVSADTAIGDLWRMGIGAELGGVVLPVRGRIQGSDDVMVADLWASFQLGLSVEF